jgi:hypothetical protein
MNVELKVQADHQGTIALPPAFLRDFKEKEIIRIAASSNGVITAVADKRHIRLYDKHTTFITELLSTGLSVEDLSILDIALAPEGDRLIVVGLLMGSDKKLLFVCDIRSKAIKVLSEYSLDEGHPNSLEKAKRIKLLMLDGKNVLVSSENYIELWYLDTIDQREFSRKIIFSYLDFPADMLPGHVKNRIEHHEAIAIQTVLFVNRSLHIFYLNRAVGYYALTTLDLEYSQAIGLEAVFKVSKNGKQEVPLRWAVKHGNQFATAQLVADADKLFIYCDDVFYRVEDGNPMSAEFTKSHRNIIARPSYAAESRVEESTERKHEESQSEELLTPKSKTKSSSSDKENTKKSPNPRAEFWHKHKKKIIAGAVGVCVVVAACALGFKYANKKTKIGQLYTRLSSAIARASSKGKKI